MISFNKEIKDTLALADIIRKDNWIDENTIIVCCSPDYSSITCQLINHSLSDINDHELFEQIFLEMPYPNTPQIWNRDKSEYQIFDKYIVEYIARLDKSYKYLFIDAATLRGKNFTRVMRCTNSRDLDVRFASLYVQDNSIFIPDYYLEKLTKEEVVFEWENPLNKNWDY